MPNNAEILAQLEKLAKAAIAGATIHVECDGLRGMAFLNALKGADFPAILAAARRWVKIEEAAKRFYWANRLEGEAKGAQLPRDRIIDAECATMSAVSELTAALKEPQ